MKVIVCPSCEKKLKVPDLILAKGTFQCPACQQTLKLPKPVVPPSSLTSAARSKWRDDEEDLVELELDAAIEDEMLDDDVVDDEFFEEDEAPRRSSKPTRGESRPGSREAKSSGLGLGVLIGVGGVFAVIGLGAVLWLIGSQKADNQVAQQNPPPVNVAPSPSNTSPPNVAPDANGIPGQPVPNLVPNHPAPSTPPVVPGQPVPANPAPQNPAPAPVVPAQPPSGQPAVAANPNNALRYKWQPNREYPYKFSIEANMGDVIERTEGLCTYRVTADPAGPKVDFKQQGTGTAFVVTADGFLVTCAHVVDGAKSIEVHLGDQKYPATVVSTDPAHDVAVIRINAQNLTPVPLTDSNTVQLGQSVRALGFPLSDVLGNNLKVTAGSVSGLNQDGTSRVFQIDAAVNPGNSGGPIVNEMGEVIGVASAKLSGPTVSTVGFARPINDAKLLLQQAGAKFLAGTAAQKLDGQTLAARVSPSVAHVHVVGGASNNRTTLAYEASFMTTQRLPAGRRGFLMPALPNIGRGSGTLTLDEFGEVVQLTGEEQLPYCLGPVALVAIVPLNPGGQAMWGRSEQTSVTRIEQDPNDPFARMRARGMRPPSFGPFANNKPKGTVFPAQETTTFTLGQQIADALLIKKSYELKTLENAANPYLHLKGEGDWRFHSKDAIPFSADLKFELARSFENGNIRVPLQFQFLFTDPQIIAAERQQSEAQQAIARTQQTQKAGEELDKLAQPTKAKLVRRFTPFEANLVPAIHLTADGQRALVATDRGPVLIFDADKPDSSGQLEGLNINTHLLTTSPDGKVVLGATMTETRIWNLESRQVLLNPQIKGFQVATAAFSADGQRAYFGFHLPQLQIWDLKTGKLSKEWKPNVIAKAITLSADGKELLSTDGKSLLRWHAETGELLKTEALPAPPAGYQSARLTLAGGWAAFNRDQKSVDVCSLANPLQTTNLPNRPAPPVMAFATNSIALSENGKRIAIADASNKNVIVWNTDSGQIHDQWQIDTIAAQTVSLSADGRFLLTCGYHKVLQLWELTD